ncbi:MAG: hypothetical protein FWD95_00555 [Nocardioidaceae bacterium]|nr:hypothetical protein [Nocardioidaceae bacterium]
MNAEIELVSDGDGLAFIGDPGAVERFLSEEELESSELALPRLSKVIGGGAAGLQAGSEIAANSGRWVKLTAESAAKVKKYGLTPTKTPGVSHAMIGKPGASQSWIQIVKGPGTMAANPALLAGGAGIMAQLAMQQTMAEITDYLARIDEKLDDVLRAQKDAVVAQMIGVGLQIEEAMTLRSHVGRVNDVTWSKIQATSGTIADTQAYALLQLDALAKKLESKSKIGDLAKAFKEVAPKVREWLAVLARCFQLLDGIAVLELDRVLETAPEDLDGYRVGLREARAERRAAISRSTDRLLRRLGDAANLANSKVLLHPSTSPELVETADGTAQALDDFHGLLGIEASRAVVEPRRWGTAANEVRERALASGAEGVDAAKRFGGDSRDKAKAATGKISNRIAERSERWRSRRNDAEVDD